MKYGSVCSGIEAASVAWEPLGWKPAWFAEIDKFPSAVLAERFPGVPNLGDMTKIKAEDHGAIDILVGGTPCQSFSVAGLRKGLDDPRGNLALEFLRLVDEARPRWVVWENVPGVLSSNEGRDFGSFIGGLGEIGYGFAYRVLDAQYFGVPQRRRRVFVIGCLAGWEPAAAVLLERQSLQGNPAPCRKTGQKAAGFTAGGFAGYREGVGTCRAAGGDVGPGSETLVPPTSHTLRGEGFDASEDGTGRGTPLVPDVAGTMVSRRSGGAGALLHDRREEGPIGFSCKDHGGDALDECTPTLRSMNNDASHANGGGQAAVASFEPGAVTTAVMQTAAVRRLTPVECERLQGFPDNWTCIPWGKKSPGDCPDGPRYKAIGNSMAVPVMRWIGERIQQVDDIIKKTETPRQECPGQSGLSRNHDS